MSDGFSEDRSPDWGFEVAGPGDGKDPVYQLLALDTAVSAMNSLRAELSSLQTFVAHAEHCIRAASSMGVPTNALAEKLTLRPKQLQAVIDGEQPLVAPVL